MSPDNVRPPSYDSKTRKIIGPQWGWRALAMTIIALSAPAGYYLAPQVALLAWIPLSVGIVAFASRAKLEKETTTCSCTTGTLTTEMAFRCQHEQLAAELVQWANKNLPAAANHLEKIKEEVAELVENPDDETEMADVLLALLLHAAEHDVDLFAAAREKFEIVKTRTYRMVGNSCRHLPENT